mgnify:CR=1 FL=1
MTLLAPSVTPVAAYEFRVMSEALPHVGSERHGAGLSAAQQHTLIEGAGHTPQRDAQDQVVQAIERFVKDLYAN